MLFCVTFADVLFDESWNGTWPRITVLFRETPTALLDPSDMLFSKVSTGPSLSFHPEDGDQFFVNQDQR